MPTPTTATPSTGTARPATRRAPLMIGIRVLLGLFGAFKLYGTVYFTFFATAAQGGDPEGLGDWLVGAWSFALAVALIVAGIGWLVTFYLSQGEYPVFSWRYWNLAIGFGAMVAALGVLSKWR